MGSLGHNLRPITRLPLFNVRTSDVRSYHKVTDAMHFVHDEEILLQRFALFIIAVVDDNDVSFAADTGYEQTVVRAILTPERHVKLTKTVCDATTLNTTDDLHFGIHLGAETNNSLTKLSQPLVLSVHLSDEERVADITLYLRSDYGPEIAAQHLLRLANAYLSPEITLNKTEASCLANPFPIHQGLENNPRQSSGLLHTILEESAFRYPHNVAIDEVTGRCELSYTRRDLTYAGLNKLASKFADDIEIVLQKLDWPALQGEQRMIPIFLPNCVELNICMNGISKAGHCFCPLQMDAPEERLRDLLNDLHAPGILGMGSNPWAGSEFGDGIIWIDYLNPMACLEGKPGILDGPLLTRHTICENDLIFLSHLHSKINRGTVRGIR